MCTPVHHTLTPPDGGRVWFSIKRIFFFFLCVRPGTRWPTNRYQSAARWLRTSGLVDLIQILRNKYIYGHQSIAKNQIYLWPKTFAQYCTLVLILDIVTIPWNSCTVATSDIKPTTRLQRIQFRKRPASPLHSHLQVSSLDPSGTWVKTGSIEMNSF